MTRRRYYFRERISRLLLTLVVLFGTLWLTPLPPIAQAAPAPAVAASRAPVAAAKPPPNPPPPQPLPTPPVTTVTNPDRPNHGPCDLWEAKPAGLQSELGNRN